MMRTVHVNASKKYDVLIERGMLKNLGRFVTQKFNKCRVALVTDDKVNSLYGQTAVESIRNYGFEVFPFIFPNGEASKNITTYNQIIEFLAENKFSRSDIIVALGGGVVGDISGFAAATYLRGISFIQVPTTFLAAVDSSVGGKTGVNLKAGKNLLGAFWQPDMVLCDCDTFDTLPKEVFADGIAEAIKYGLIADKELFGLIQAGIFDQIEPIVQRCVEIKSRIVQNDEFDKGERQLLNFGHTFGHAIEKCSGYSISHGHAVAIGMVMASRISEKIGLADKDSLQAVIGLLRKYELPVGARYTAEELTDAMLSDKKVSRDKINLILLKQIGSCMIYPLASEILTVITALGIE